MSAVDLIGRGWQAPLAIDPVAGGLGWLDGPAKVRQAIWTILDTEPGERVMRPAFGCGLRRHLMKPNTVATRALIRHEVEHALETWEPRIALRSVDCTQGDDPALVDIAVSYVLRADRRPDNLVYPFSLE